MNDIEKPAIEATTVAGHHAVIDGRAARRSRNRDAVLNALIELAREGHDEPPINLIARRAGVSYRSVYRYFEDRTELMLAAIDHSMIDVWPLLDPKYPISGTFDERVAMAVESRVTVYRKLAPLSRIAFRRRLHEPEVAEHYAHVRGLFRTRLTRQFQPELAKLPADERLLVIASLSVALQFEALDYLTQCHQMTEEQLKAVLAHQIRSLLGPVAT